MTIADFPAGFVWGAATAAYQVEGAVAEDGRGASIWDEFVRVPGNVADGGTGDPACDHYHRYPADVRLMKDLGLKAYRFSVSWPRVQPAGSGAVNAAGLDFYDRLVDELLAAGIAPYATLYHWDLPQCLEDLGGWTNRDTAFRFALYAQAVHDRLGDRVTTWVTINEPWVAAFLGYGVGLHAPGRTSAKDAFQAAHHLLLAHGLGAQALRAAGAAEITATLNLAPVHGPAADAEAVNRVDCLLNRQFLDPILRGEYPAELLSIAERSAGLGHIHDGDLAVIHQPIELLGVNYYTPTVVRSAPGRPANPAFPGSEGIAFGATDAPTTAMGWAIVPEGLTQLLVRLAGDYPGTGLLVMENGAAFDDVLADGRVRDADRTAFLDGHLRAAHAAIEAGVDLRGYLVWSLLDNFEWADGHRRRFGIVHVDFATQRRVLKDSAHWYREVIRRNGLGEDRLRRPTLETVAARAGVSRSTVSRVINGEVTVGRETRDLVLRAVQELGYVPNSAARSLVTRRTGSIAIVVSQPGDREDAGDPALVLAAGRELARHGKQSRLAFAKWTEGVERIVVGEQVDGVLLVPAYAGDPLPGELAGLGVPVVSIGRPDDGHHGHAAVPYVDAGDREGAAAAVAHLLAGGRRRIAAIGGPDDLVAVRDRLAGYRDALGDEGGDEGIVVRGDLSAASGAAAVRTLLQDVPDVDAVFAVDDRMAVGALHALREAGRRVPDEVAVIGFGDDDAAAFAVPPLSTVRGPGAALARAGVRLLLERLRGGAGATMWLRAELVRRSST